MSDLTAKLRHAAQFGGHYAAAADEIERLQGIIVKAYQRLGFTNHKNETMRILGTGLPNAQNPAQTTRSRILDTVEETMKDLDAVEQVQECDHDRARLELDIVCINCGKMLLPAEQGLDPGLGRIYNCPRCGDPFPSKEEQHDHYMRCDFVQGEQ